MTSYRVDPAGVQSVLGDAVKAAEPIFDAAGRIGATAQQAITAGQSQLIAEALGAYFDAVKPQMDFIGTRFPAAVNGTVQATTAVLEGDEAMASQIASDAAGLQPAGGVRPR